MIEVSPSLYVGNDKDYLAMGDSTGWVFVHAAKEPWHRKALGYTTPGAPKTDPEYLFAYRDKSLILNMIDSYNVNFISAPMIDEAIKFIGESMKMGYKVLVHCNHGLSRGPSLAFIYMLVNEKIVAQNFNQAEKEFLKLYPEYNPAAGIYDYIAQNFRRYTTVKSKYLDLPEEPEKPTEIAVRKPSDDGRDENGRTFTRPPANAHIITSADASKLARKRWDMAREKANDGLESAVESSIEAGIIPDLKHTKGDAWFHVAKHAGEVYFKSNSARGLSELGGFLGQITGNMVTKDMMKEENEENKTIDATQAQNIYNVFQYIDQRKQDDGKIIDA